MGRATRTTVPEDTANVAEALAAAGRRLEALQVLGVDTPELAAKLADGRAALEAGSLAAAQARADEVRIVVKLAAGELSRMLNHDGPPVANMLASAMEREEAERGEADCDEAPEADLSEDVAAVVQDAFGKALYSKQLRQMVEIVAAERLREFLSDPETLGPLIASRVRQELRDAVAEAQAQDAAAAKRPKRKR
jgi:hypothetical protein